jgi:hypothetical protein
MNKRTTRSGPLSPAGERAGVRVLAQFKCKQLMPGDFIRTRLSA